MILLYSEVQGLSVEAGLRLAVAPTPVIRASSRDAFDEVPTQTTTAVLALTTLGRKEAAWLRDIVHHRYPSCVVVTPLSIGAVQQARALDLSRLGGDCTGYVDEPPDVRLRWTGSTDELVVGFVASEYEDATSGVRLPDGSWECNDDGPDELDPLVRITGPTAGEYTIWVGSYEEGEVVSGELFISERGGN